MLSSAIEWRNYHYPWEGHGLAFSSNTIKHVKYITVLFKLVHSKSLFLFYLKNILFVDRNHSQHHYLLKVQDRLEKNIPSYMIYLYSVGGCGVCVCVCVLCCVVLCCVVLCCVVLCCVVLFFVCLFVLMFFFFCFFVLFFYGLNQKSWKLLSCCV